MGDEVLWCVGFAATSGQRVVQVVRCKVMEMAHGRARDRRVSRRVPACWQVAAAMGWEVAGRQATGKRA